MSSRALRKLQREQELQKQLAATHTGQEENEEDDEVEDEEDDTEHPVIIQNSQFNAFDMLGDAPEEEEITEGDNESISQENSNSITTSAPRPTQSSKSKKKKKKAKKKAKEKVGEHQKGHTDSGDEIDRALKEISAKKNTNQLVGTEQASTNNWEVSATKLLAIDSKNLNPMTEMKSLFGNIALEGQESRSNPRNQRRREQNQQGGVDLATALTGRYSISRKELGTLASRRNVFMTGKEEWPLATSGGLSMEHTPDSMTFEKKYNILHNSAYEETQMHFRMAVESMDPQRMIGLLTVNPYHIATLLQVSEIARHQGDHSVSADLLERALYSFGRSVHSSFPAALREGTARLKFQRYENREMYLTIWRYIRNLEMRGTWRTAFEWSKILLQLNTVSDPFGVTLMIDQLAIRGRQYLQLIDLCSDEAYGPAWAHLPNIQISLVLAFLRAARPKDARRQLAISIHRYPYILSSLASALDISPLPKSLWAKLPSTDAEKLYCELYVSRAKDLWNTPETTSLLVEVADTLEHYKEAVRSAAPPAKLQISLEEARHIMLLETPALIALLPRQFTQMPTSSSDVLPPPDSNIGLRARAPADASGASAMQTLFNAAGATADATGGVLQRILNWFHAPAGPNDVGGESEGQAAFRDLQAELGNEASPEVIEQLLRMHLHEADEDHITARGLGMAGDWNSDDEDVDDDHPDTESMPDLADDPEEAGAQQSQNPRAARVEEDSEEEIMPRASITTGHAVLRHVDSDDEVDSDGIAPHPAPTHTMFAPMPPTSRSSIPPQSREPQVDENDPQRVQRWLLAAGLTDLQRDPTALQAYVRRLQILRKQQQDWVVSIVRQRAGADLADRIKGAM